MPPANEAPVSQLYQPQQPSPQPQQSQSPQWDNLSRVTYYQDATSLNQMPAALVALGDYVQLYRVDEATDQLSEQLFSARWSEISKVVTTMNMIKFTAQGKSIRVDFNRAMTRAMQEMPLAVNVQAAGLAPAVVGQAMEQRDMNQAINNVQGQDGDNFRWWLQALQTHGVPMKDSISNKFLEHPFRMVGIIFGALILLGILYLVVGSLMSGY